MARDGADGATAVAIAGVWLLAPAPDLTVFPLIFSIEDTSGRLRLWMFMPPLEAMVGRGHLWLSKVPYLETAGALPMRPHGWPKPPGLLF